MIVHYHRQIDCPTRLYCSLRSLFDCRNYHYRSYYCYSHHKRYRNCNKSYHRQALYCLAVNKYRGISRRLSLSSQPPGCVFLLLFDSIIPLVAGWVAERVLLIDFISIIYGTDANVYHWWLSKYRTWR